MIRFIGGALTLLLAAAFFFGAFPGSYLAIAEGDASHVNVPVISGVVLVLITVALWTSALRRAGGDDVFSGERGKLVSAMILAILVVAGLFLVMVFNPDAWRGFIDGSRS